MPNPSINFRSKRLWLLAVISMYSAFGWVGVPLIVNSQLPSVLKDVANWHTEIEDISFNPFALSLSLENAKISDQANQQIITFERFYVNFSLLDSLTGSISFDDILLETPNVLLEIDANGTSNFQKAFANNESENKPEPDSSPLGFYFKSIAITQGKVDIADSSLGEQKNIAISPLSLQLLDFSTSDNLGGEYALSIALGEKQTLDWKGTIGISPFESEGWLNLKNIHSDIFWHYAKNNSPYWLNNALVSLKGKYKTSVSSTTELIVEDASLAVKSIAMAMHQGEHDWFTLDSLEIGKIDFNLQEQTLSSGQVLISSPSLSLQKLPDNNIDILQPLATTNVETKVESEPPTKQAPFKWKIDGVNLTNGTVNWQDRSIRTPASVALKNINIDLGKLSHNLDEPVPYVVNFLTDTSPQSMSGDITMQPFNLLGKLKIESFPLNWLQPYLSENANINIESGVASIESQYQISESESLTGLIKAEVQLKELTLNDSINNKRLSGFERLSIGPIKIAFGADGDQIDVDLVELINPFADIYVSEKGEMNLAQLSTTSVQEQQTKVDNEKHDPAPQDSGQSLSPKIAIAAFEIQRGQFQFTDSSKSPSFISSFDKVSGSIRNLSSAPEAQSHVDISGDIDGYSQLKIIGTLNPLGKTPNTNLDIAVNNIDMSSASPYAAQYAGYLIDKGKLDLDLNYQINNNQLNAKNHIFIDQFEFGDSVDSPDATSLPLPLAIGIMKNFKGEIDIDLPISGDLDDPSFSVGGVVLGAFTNLITKIVTSPFSILGALVEGSDDISTVDFLSGKSNLTSPQESKVLTLTKALNERPNLNLEIRATADASVDGKADLQLLAKERARTLSDLIIGEGGINKERVYILDPQINPNLPDESIDLDLNASVSSSFTLSVR